MYARHLCLKAGVQFVLGRPQGDLEHLIIEGSGSSKRATGIKTRDGKSHSADLVIVACKLLPFYLGFMSWLLTVAGGPWTTSVLPESHRSVEATMGTVMFVDIPSHRQDLRKKFHPDNFPIWRFIQGEGEG